MAEAKTEVDYLKDHLSGLLSGNGYLARESEASAKIARAKAEAKHRETVERLLEEIRKNVDAIYMTLPETAS